MSTTTYFIRHGRDWHVGQDEKRRLRENGLIAIHYEPKASVDPRDYKKEHQQFIRRFVQIAKDGGWVVSTHPPEPSIWIGEVPPGSEIAFRHVRNEAGDTVVLKILRLSAPKRFSAELASRLLAIQPRQQTLCTWTSVGDRARELYENGRHRIRVVSDFMPFEQEVICGEFLRSDLTQLFQLPKIAHFLFPIGRSLPDIDIAGVTGDGKRVLAQVTFKGRTQLGEKLTSLQSRRSASTSLVMFCNDTDRVDADDVHFVPLQSAIEQMMRFSPVLAQSLGYDP